MAKPDPALLDPARYPFRCDIETRFGDLDLNQHINNVALTGLLEEARVRFHKAIGLRTGLAGGHSVMITSLSVEFLGQSYFPDPLTVHVGLGRIGRTSYQLVKLAVQGDRRVAFAAAVMVCVHKGVPEQVPESLRSTAADWMIAP